MPPKRKAPLPPVPGVEEAPPKLCGECFPAGLDGTPEGATVVSCAHGMWHVDELTAATSPPPEDPPKTPEDPKTPEQDPDGDKGDGTQ